MDSGICYPNNQLLLRCCQLIKNQLINRNLLFLCLNPQPLVKLRRRFSYRFLKMLHKIVHVTKTQDIGKLRDNTFWMLMQIRCECVPICALRAADSLQLAAGLVWAGKTPKGRSFVCLDRKLREAARKDGLRWSRRNCLNEEKSPWDFF